MSVWFCLFFTQPQITDAYIVTVCVRANVFVRAGEHVLLEWFVFVRATQHVH